MKKYYILFLFFTTVFFVSLDSVAQENAFNFPVQETIEGLSIYPNPLSSGKNFVYITSKRNLNKTVEFYNVLGKQILYVELTGAELDVSALNKGVYILKIIEGNVSETRKLVIK